MIMIIPIFLAIAGLAVIFTRRRYKALNDREASRVVVKGDTYSEIVEKEPTTTIEIQSVETVRRCCIIGASRVGAVTGIVLASQNPDVQFCIVDSDARRIASWKSDTLPIFEPGLDDIFFDDQCIAITDENIPTSDTLQIEKIAHAQRRRKLSNLTFSTDIHTSVAAADLIFLCLEMEPGLVLDDPKSNFHYLDPTLQVIAHGCTGHKILVQRAPAPYGAVQYIKNRLKDLSPPQPLTTSFTILTNPSFTLPGRTISDMINPTRVIIGHIYGSDSSPASLSALKTLYTPWIPDDRIVTMDAWSAELGRIASKAVLAQQMAAVDSVGMLCEGGKASMGSFGWMLGLGVEEVGIGSAELRGEIRCLVFLARGLGFDEVAEYWGAVLRVQEAQCRRVAGRVVRSLAGDEEKRVAVVGVMEGEEMTVVFVRELKKAGVLVRVVDDVMGKEQVESVLRGVDGQLDGIEVADSLEAACQGCGAVVFHGARGVSHEVWQRIFGQMKAPMGVLAMGNRVDRVQMQQLGFVLL
ncbi:hypothetical protein BDW59DRAFT_180360 [Aspergillus cavernicola]|uniref:UDP-glucose/GDP-mannose dehydrogenase N-terminal domain-containing protein n=1 Tax=Aspergillus cavernicola TaxID=176166 RepID=A0ABR4I951_9EURO